MGITYGDYLIDSGYRELTPEQENKMPSDKLTSDAECIAGTIRYCGWPSCGCEPCQNKGCCNNRPHAAYPHNNTRCASCPRRYPNLLADRIYAERLHGNANFALTKRESDMIIAALRGYKADSGAE